MRKAVVVAEMAVTEAEIAWTEVEVADPLKDDVIVIVVNGVGGAASQMTALCVGRGDDVIRTALIAATTYMYNSSTGNKTAG